MVHIYLYEPRSNAFRGLLSRLDEAQWEPVAVNDDLFDRELDLLGADGYADRRQGRREARDQRPDLDRAGNGCIASAMTADLASARRAG